MNAVVFFLIVWLSLCLLLFGGVTCPLWFDRLAVFVLRFVDSPLYPEARMVAALIYQHPEQWKASSYSMEHPRVGRITGSSQQSVEIAGDFGKWEPSAIERRIIFNALHWFRTVYMKRLLVRALETPSDDRGL